MDRLIAIIATALIVAAQAVAASPKEDAAYLAQQTLRSDTVETIRGLHGPSLTAAYEDYFATLGVGIANHDRFAPMLPDSRANRAIESILQKIEALYLDRFTAGQLAEIAAFHRTALGQKLVSVPERQPAQDSDGNTARYSIYARGRDDLVSLLTSEEQEAFDAFYGSVAGKALNDNASEIAQMMGFFAIGGLVGGLQSEPQIDTDPAFVLDVLETEGVISFPNRIWRRDLIERARGDLP